MATGSGSSRYGLAWTRSSLRPNARLVAVRAEVDARFQKAAPPTATDVERLRDAALAHPDDRAGLLRWAYSAAHLSKLENQRGRNYWGSSRRRFERNVLEWSIAAAKGTDDYEYVRMRFLVEAGGATVQNCCL